jgi:hypothetical protein
MDAPRDPSSSLLKERNFANHCAKLLRELKTCDLSRERSQSFPIPTRENNGGAFRISGRGLGVHALVLQKVLL